VRSTAAPAQSQREGIVDLSRNIIKDAAGLDLDARALSAVRPFLRDAEYAPAEGLLRHRAAAAAWLRRSGLDVAPDRIVITPGAHQAMVAILAALCRPGDTILCEEYTYPRFNTIAGLLNLRVQTVAVDDRGVVPSSLEKACKRVSPKALYLIPNLQNPTGSVMPEKRRREIAAILKRYALPAIEDDVYGFLLEAPPPPIASFAPEQTAFVTSASKSMTPSLRIGIAAVPQTLVERVTLAFAATTAFTSSAAAELFTQLIESGAADRTVESKRVMIATHRRAAERVLGGANLAAHPMSPHLWITLPPSLDAHDLAERARMRGIVVTPSSTFAIERSSSANAIRICLGSVTESRQLESALRTLASLIEYPRMGSGTVV
jgi:DNA-binding transcriptional MocR family regulator